MPILSLMLVASVVVAAADGPALTPDQEKVQGSWVVEKQDMGRLWNHLKEMLPQFVQLDIKGDVCTVIGRSSSTDPEEQHKLTLILDGKKTPGSMDLVPKGEKSGLKAIYKFGKDGSLSIAIGMPGDDRPKGFDSSKEYIFVLVLKKKKENGISEDRKEEK